MGFVVLGLDGGGPIEGRLLVLSRDLTLESEVRALVVGVPVRGVEAPELLLEASGLVGDFVGDYTVRVSCVRPCHQAERQIGRLTRIDNREVDVEFDPIKLCLLRAVSAVIPLEGRAFVETPLVDWTPTFPFVKRGG